MQIIIKDKLYESPYYPFFRKKHKDGISVYGLRFQDNTVNYFTVLDTQTQTDLLKMLIEEYVLEDDIALTDSGRELKQKMINLFTQKGNQNESKI